MRACPPPGGQGGLTAPRHRWARGRRGSHSLPCGRVGLRLKARPRPTGHSGVSLSSRSWCPGPGATWHPSQPPRQAAPPVPPGQGPEGSGDWVFPPGASVSCSPAGAAPLALPRVSGGVWGASPLLGPVPQTWPPGLTAPLFFGSFLTPQQARSHASPGPWPPTPGPCPRPSGAQHPAPTAAHPQRPQGRKGLFLHCPLMNVP